MMYQHGQFKAVSATFFIPLVLVAIAVFALIGFVQAAQPLNTIININTATVDQIERGLPGIGKVKAQAIVRYRDNHGPFTAIEQLLNIKGVGPHTLKKMMPLISFDNTRLGHVQKVSLSPQTNLQAQDQSIRNDIKRIVTRAKQNTLE